MTLIRYAAVVLLLLALGACGDTSPGRAADPGASPTPDPVSLEVHRHWQQGAGGEMYMEGSVTTYELVDADGQKHKPATADEDGVVYRDLVPGRYVLRSAERPCDGNCGYLDAPVDQCERHIELTEDTSVDLQVTVGQPCTLR
jgi:hypothetical protein